MIAPEYCTPERTAYFIEAVRAISGDGLNPGFGRVTEADENSFTMSFTIFNSHVERFAKAWPNLVEEERQRLASGTLTEGGDVKQAPGDSLSGPTLEEGDAEPSGQSR